MAFAAAVPRTGSSTLVDGVTLLAVVIFIPFAMLAIGVPLALGVRLVLWLGQLL